MTPATRRKSPPVHPAVARRVVQPLALCATTAVWLSGCLLFSAHEENSRTSRLREYTTWKVAGGDPGVTRYSELSQIDRSNVHRLQVAWTYRSGDNWEGSTIQSNPIVIDGVLYSTTPSLHVVALDATTGVERWRFDPFEGGQGHGTNRGVTYWEDGADRRILFSAGQYLHALDAVTGEAVPGFGEAGRVDMRQGLGRDPETFSISSPAPGVIFENLIVMGSMGSAPGHVRAYDVRTGAIAWIFHTIPHPGEPFHETWEGEAWKTAEGANVWGGLSVDHEHGMVFFAAGSPKPNFMGWLHKGRNVYANSVVALRAATGERVWHFQEIRHDIWDLDLPAAPILVTVRRGRREIPAVAQVSKTGHTYLLDRLTGESLFPVAEHPVPASEIPLEQAWPTQPRPARPPPFSRQVVTEAELTTLTPEAHRDALARFRNADAGWFRPVGTRGTIFYGIHGGAEWGGASFDPTTGVLYINANNIPWILTLEEAAPTGAAVSARAAAGEGVYQRNCLVCHGAGRQGVPPVHSLLNVAQQYPAAEVAALIRTGRGQMPAFSHLPAEELTALLAYLGYREVGDDEHDVEATVDLAHAYRFTGFNRFLDQEGYPAVQPPWAR